MIDLHLHSIFSDGSYTPEELIDLAVENRVEAIALTDHDTTKGVARLIKAGKEKGVAAVPGVEISADYSPGTMHILGYFIQPEEKQLVEHLEWIRNGREARNKEILHNLMELGVHITWDQVRACAGDDVVGRPHFAKVMLQQGYVETTKEAFNRFLAKGQPAYAGRRRLKPEACIELILGAGGLPVLAHPCSLQTKGSELRRLLKRLSAAGLQGMEIHYPEHTKDMVKTYLKLAKQHNLVVTGGTDFHGELTPDITIGRGFGGLKVPNSVLDDIRLRLVSIRSG